MSRYGYPKEAVVFEVLTDGDVDPANWHSFRAGDHVEGVDVVGDWRVGTLGVTSAEPVAVCFGGECRIHQGLRLDQVRPLTPAARDFLAIVKAQLGE